MSSEELQECKIKRDVRPFDPGPSQDLARHGRGGGRRPASARGRGPSLRGRARGREVRGHRPGAGGLCFVKENYPKYSSKNTHESAGIFPAVFAA